MLSRVEGEVYFYVPLQGIKRRTAALEAPCEGRIVSHGIRQGIPMAWWCFRVRTICPEFGNHAAEVGQVDEVRCVGLTGIRIDDVSGSRVRSQAVVLPGASR